MTRTEFERDLTAAKTLSRFAEESDFWIGYQRGLRRAYYGARFGTECEHVAWMQLCEDGEDASRRARGRGYRAGFSATATAAVLGGCEQ